MRISDWSSDVCSSDLTGEDRTDHYLPLTQVADSIRRHRALTPIPHRTGGPARYHAVDGLKARLGLITPLTHNFCADCNRMRMTCEGKIFMRSEEHTSELQSLMRISYAVFSLTQKTNT